MPLMTIGSATDDLIGKYFNPETMEFQDEPIAIDVPTLPEKLSQEELRYMRMIAEARVRWSIARGDTSVQLHRVSSTASSQMKEAYAKIAEAEMIASLFVPKKRIKEITNYAKKYPQAVFYTCEVQKVR